MSVISDQTSKEPLKASISTTSQQNESNESKRQQKRDSRHTINDEEPVTDWIPEIPFWNVS